MTFQNPLGSKLHALDYTKLFNRLVAILRTSRMETASSTRNQLRKDPVIQRQGFLVYSYQNERNFSDLKHSENSKHEKTFCQTLFHAIILTYQQTEKLGFFLKYKNKMRKIKYNKITWLDFPDPSGDDVVYLQENFNIHPVAIEEFITPTIRPRATQYTNCLFMTIHIPLFDTRTRTTYPGELDIILTKDHVITGHKEDIFQLTDFFNKVSESEGKKMLYMDKTPAHLLYQILSILLESCFPKLDHIHNNLIDIEEQVFNGREKEMVFEISIVKRDILNFRRTLKPQRSVLESLTQKNTPFIAEDLIPYFQDLIGTNIRLWNSLESNKETIESLEETNNSLLSNKLNMTMKVLTIFSAVMMPMTVYSNILAMSADIPFGNNPFGFWIHIAIMLFISLLTILAFKAKRWL